MIEYKEIPPQYVDVYDSEGLFHATVNEHELYDIRLQIKNQELKGYYVLFNDGKVIHHIDINIKGQLSNWPKGFFDLTDSYLTLLLDWGTPISTTT
jgi:hypothetical protein